MPLSNPKIDAELSLSLGVPEDVRLKSESLSSGYDSVSKKWSVVVKYNGDILNAVNELGASIELLSDIFAIITVDEDKLELLAGHREVDYIEKSKVIGRTVINGLREACIRPVQNYAPYRLDGSGVILGIIDSGIDYAHPDFINEDGTSRILYIWDLSIEGDPPEGFTVGTEYSQEQINAALQAQTLQQRMEIVPHEDTIGHGTHVASIAGGNGRASKGSNNGVAGNAQFIIVKLGAKLNGTTSRSTDLMRGAKYIVDKAELLSKPVVINISFGTNDGPHSGDSLFESFLDDLSLRWKSVIVAATGNEGTAGHHTSGSLNNVENAEVQFVVAKGLSSLLIEIWKSFVDKYDIEIISPSGNRTGRISYNANRYAVSLGNHYVYVYFGEPTPINGDQNIVIDLIPKTESLNEGIWTIKFYVETVVNDEYDIWLPITELVTNNTRFIKPVANVTLTEPSSARNIISVGGFDAYINSIAPFSGRGNTRYNVHVKPDIVAPCVNILAAVPGGGYDSFTGTSMAAPFVAGAAALMMQWGIVNGNDPYLYGQKLAAYLKLGASRDANRNYPNPEWGFGKLCLLNTFRFLENNQAANRNIVRKGEGNEYKAEE